MAFKQGDIATIASSTDNALVRWDGTTGLAIQNGVITEDDTGNLSIAAAVSGGNLSAIVSNTSNTASAQAFYQAQVAGGTAADAYVETNINGGQAWSFGLDNSDSDAFVVSSNATLGTTNVMRVATSGEITYPLQSTFLAYMTTSVNNISGDGTLYTIIFDTEAFDRNNDFTLGTSTFTAPVTGLYSFNLGVQLGGGTIMTNVFLQVVTTALTYQRNIPNTAGSTTTASGTHVVLANMTAADTATFNITSTDSGGKVDDVLGLSTGFARTWVSGWLVA